MSGAWKWTKMLSAGFGVVYGGHLLVQAVLPTDAELRGRYNPELRARAEAQGDEKSQEFDDFVMKLKAASKSNKPVWTVLAEMEKKDKKREERRLKADTEEARARREEMRKEAGLGRSHES